MADDVTLKEDVELRFWESSPTERPGANSLQNLLDKSAEARVFLQKLESFGHFFSSAGKILELGGGQGWAACIIKRLYPASHVTLTDISPAAIASVHVWEHAFGVRVDDAAACRSYETPFDSSSFDLIFAYEAAHHFRRHQRTLREVRRLLKDDGVAIYLHEPGCPNYIHAAAHYRVNRKRPEVPEDVLRYREIEGLAREVGLDATTYFSTLRTNRRPIETIYYTVLHAVPPLQRILPCTVDIVMRVKGT